MPGIELKHFTYVICLTTTKPDEVGEKTDAERLNNMLKEL